MAERTRNLAAHYGRREGEMVAADLRGGKAMGEQLQKLSELRKSRPRKPNCCRAAREVAQSDLRLRKAEARAIW